MKHITPLILFLFFPYLSYSQLVTYPFTGAVGNEISFPANAQPTNGTAGSMSRGTGLTPDTGANQFGARNFPLTGLDQIFQF